MGNKACHMAELAMFVRIMVSYRERLLLEQRKVMEICDSLTAFMAAIRPTCLIYCKLLELEKRTLNIELRTVWQQFLSQHLTI